LVNQIAVGLQQSFNMNINPINGNFISYRNQKERLKELKEEAIRVKKIEKIHSQKTDDVVKKPKETFNRLV